MNISHFCIDRPIFASVISIVIMLGGAVAMSGSPIAQYPDITPPQITVAATYPGATADVVANNVAAPIEQQVNGVDNMIYMNSSSSSTGNMHAQRRLSRSAPIPNSPRSTCRTASTWRCRSCRRRCRQQGIQVQKKSSAFMMVIAIYSPDERYDADLHRQLREPVRARCAEAHSRREPVAASSARPTTRCASGCKPDRMAQLGVTAADVQKARREPEPAVRASASIGAVADRRAGRAVVRRHDAPGRLTEPDEFENIIIRAASGGAAIVRLKDIGRAELGQQRLFDPRAAERQAGDHDRRSTSSRAPTRSTCRKQVRKTLEEMKKSFPDGLDYRDRDGHDPVHARVDRRGGAYLLRGGGAGGARGVRVPAEPARDADPDPRGAGVDRRHVHRHDGARLLDQHADAVRHGARDRHRGRRRDRRDRERRAQHDTCTSSIRRRRPSARWTRSRARWSRSCWCCARCSCRWRSSAA